MKRTYWIYKNVDCRFNIEKVPIYLERLEEEGNYENGRVSFRSTGQVDEIWGADVKLEVTWEKCNRITYNHGSKIKESIEMYNTLQVSVVKKQHEWIKSHEMTYWVGTRNKIKRKRFYASTIIHALYLCEVTERFFEIHVEIISSLFPNYENLILDAIKSMNCHDL